MYGSAVSGLPRTLPTYKPHPPKPLYCRSEHKPHQLHTLTSDNSASRNLFQHTYGSLASGLARILPLRKPQAPRQLDYTLERTSHQTRTVSLGNLLFRNLLQHTLESSTSGLPCMFPLRKRHLPKPLPHTSQGKSPNSSDLGMLPLAQARKRYSCIDNNCIFRMDWREPHNYVQSSSRQNQRYRFL